jgi:hypothetical protein
MAAGFDMEVAVAVVDRDRRVAAVATVTFSMRCLLTVKWNIFQLRPKIPYL